MREIKYSNSEAENKFFNYIKEKRPELKVTKKGLPDFMIIKNKKVFGFVEVKRSEINDCLTEEQNLFRLFCREHNIPYQVWSPMMASERWKKGRKDFKLAFTYGGEIWDEI